MNVKRHTAMRRRAPFTMLVSVLWIIGIAAGAAFGHALGNFTINHFARLNIVDERITIRYVVDLA